MPAVGREVPFLRFFEVEKSRFFVKMLRVDLQKYASYIGGEHIFRKVREKSNRKVKDLVKMMLGTSKITHKGIAYIKVSLQ